MARGRNISTVGMNQRKNLTGSHCPKGVRMWDHCNHPQEVAQIWEDQSRLRLPHVSRERGLTLAQVQVPVPPPSALLIYGNALYLSFLPPNTTLLSPAHPLPAPLVYVGQSILPTSRVWSSMGTCTRLFYSPGVADVLYGVFATSWVCASDLC